MTPARLLIPRHADAQAMNRTETPGRFHNLKSISVHVMCALFFSCAFVASANNEDSDHQTDSNDHVEEVIVTGTYMKSSTSRSHSLLTIVDRVALDVAGASDTQEFVAQLTANTASLGNSASNWVGGDNSEGQASVNLRNLGSGATLVLVRDTSQIRSDVRCRNIEFETR